MYFWRGGIYRWPDIGWNLVQVLARRSGPLWNPCFPSLLWFAVDFSSSRWHRLVTKFLCVLSFFHYSRQADLQVKNSVEMRQTIAGSVTETSTRYVVKDLEIFPSYNNTMKSYKMRGWNWKREITIPQFQDVTQCKPVNELTKFGGVELNWLI